MKITGLKQFKAQLKKAERAIHDDVYASVNKSLFMIEGKALELVSGEMRAVLTGMMRSTLTHYIAVANKNVILGEVGYCVYYALSVHEGYGPHTGNPRPTLVAALDNKREKVVAVIRTALKKRLSGKI